MVQARFLQFLVASCALSFALASTSHAPPSDSPASTETPNQSATPEVSGDFGAPGNDTMSPDQQTGQLQPQGPPTSTGASNGPMPPSGGNTSPVGGYPGVMSPDGHCICPGPGSGAPGGGQSGNYPVDNNPGAGGGQPGNSPVDNNPGAGGGQPVNSPVDNNPGAGGGQPVNSPVDNNPGGGGSGSGNSGQPPVDTSATEHGPNPTEQTDTSAATFLNAPTNACLLVISAVAGMVAL